MWPNKLSCGPTNASFFSDTAVKKYKWNPVMESVYKGTLRITDIVRTTSPTTATNNRSTNDTYFDTFLTQLQSFLNKESEDCIKWLATAPDRNNVSDAPSLSNRTLFLWSAASDWHTARHRKPLSSIRDLRYLLGHTMCVHKDLFLWKKRIYSLRNGGNAEVVNRTSQTFSTMCGCTIDNIYLISLNSFFAQIDKNNICGDVV